MRYSRDPSLLERINSADSMRAEKYINGHGPKYFLNGHHRVFSSSSKTYSLNNGGMLSDKLGFRRSLLNIRHDEKSRGSESLKQGNSNYASVRPLSAPEGSPKKSQRRLSQSAKTIRKSQTRAVTHNEKTEMYKVVEAAKEAKIFQKETEGKRNPKPEEKNDAAPVFNKRLFASQGTVIMTREARRLMGINEIANENFDVEKVLTKTEMLCLRCITEGLKLVHKGQDFVKDVLSLVVTYEVYNAFEYVPCKHWEESLSCYYILNGAVEVTYDLRASESRNVYQANIIYSHGTGEYVGLVSSEGPSDDLTPPATIYTKELTQFIRIDRKRFHKLMQKATVQIDKKKWDFISSHSFLSHVADDVKEKILHKLSIRDFPANRILLSQGELTENVSIVMTGRCQTYREVYIPESEKTVLFYLTSREPDDFFGEECVLERSPSSCTVVTATATTVLRLHKSALQMVNRDRLTKYIEAARHVMPDDEELRTRGYKDSVWNKFKHTEVKSSLQEAGKLRYLSKVESAVIHERPPNEEEQYAENMRQFVIKGNKFDPIRAQSAIIRRYKHGLPRRPQSTAFVSQLASTGSFDDVDGKAETPEPEPKPVSLPPKSGKPREVEKHVLRAMESSDNLMKVLEDHGDMAALKQAWKDDSAQDNQNFMKNGVLVTMRSEDIVRKAKALAETYADKWKTKLSDNTEDWDTVLHSENKEARTKIQANKMRIRDLNRRLVDLQKRREKVRQNHRQRHTLKWEPSVETSDVSVTISVKNDDVTQPKSTKADKDNNTNEEHELSDLEDIDPESLPMYKMTDERLKLLKSWDTDKWSLDVNNDVSTG